MAKRRVSKKIALERKLRDYKAILKDDEDWDWAFIIKLLRYKLERTRKCIDQNRLIVDHKKVAKQILTVEQLFERILENDYLEEIGKDFFKKNGRPKWIFEKAKPGQKLISSTSRFPRETPRNSVRLHREYLSLVRRSYRMQCSDMNRALALMAKNIWNWWD